MPTEPTFHAYNRTQSAQYAQYRRAYHPNFYQLLLTQHTTTGGQLDTVLDVGCGPGIATHDLARFFKRAIGIDASKGMIEMAWEGMKNPTPEAGEAAGDGANSATPSNIRFGISTAETLGSELTPPVEEGSIDLITAATAAHWFDMPAFWRRAAVVLKPGGSVALWTGNAFRIHPSVPNVDAIQTRMDHYRDTYLSPFFEPGTHIGEGLYATIPLPWTLDEPVKEFEEGSFKKVWMPGDTEIEGNEFVEGDTRPIPLDVMEKMLGTGSPITRWRQANPEKTGEEDVVRMIRREIERLLREAGVKEGEEYIMGSMSAVLIVVKKSRG